MSSFSNFLTNAGDSGVLLPLALVSSGLLWLTHSGRAAWLLLRSVLLAVVLIVALKIFFLWCGTHWEPSLISPSGHACLSAAVFGCLGTVAAAGRPSPARAMIAVLVALMVGTIAASRALMGVHTWAEVIVGLGVGLSAVALFAWSYKRTAPRCVDLTTFAVALIATLLLTIGIRLPAESAIRHVARSLGENCKLAGIDRTIRVQLNLGPRKP